PRFNCNVHMIDRCSCKKTRPSDVTHPMESTHTIRLRWLHSTLAGGTHQLGTVRISRSGSHAWRPAINAYRCKNCIRICVDLAGVDKADINLTIQDQHLSIRGVRDVPEPEDEKKHA